MDSDRPIGVFRPTGVSVTVSGVWKADREPIVLRRSTAAPRCAAALAVAGLLTLIVPAAAAASVRILNDPLSAQAELVNAQTWAEVAGSITFGASVQGDTVVALTGSPRRRCAQQPPPGSGATPARVPTRRACRCSPTGTRVLRPYPDPAGGDRADHAAVRVSIAERRRDGTRLTASQGRARRFQRWWQLRRPLRRRRKRRQRERGCWHWC